MFKRSINPVTALLVLFTFSLNSCVDDTVLTKSNNSIIANGFTFATIKTINLSVAVNDNYNSNYFYKVEVFDQNPFRTDTTSNLLLAGVAKGNSPFSAKIDVPVHVSTIYVKQTDPLQHITIKAYSIDNQTTDLNCDFGSIVFVATTKMKALKSIAIVSPKATDYSLHGSYIPIDGSSITLDGNNYYVPAGTLNPNINFGWKSGSSLYVAGEVVFSNFYIPGDCKLVVLPGGKVTFNTSADFEQPGDIVAVHPGGTLILNQSGGGVGNNAIMINDGTTNMPSTYEIRTNGQLINNGTLTGGQLTLTNNCQFVNNLNTTFSTAFIMNTNATFVNNGVFEATGSIQLYNSTCVITNNNHIKTNYFNLTNGQIDNNCSIACGYFSMQGATVSSSTGTLIQCQDLYANNSTITLNGNAVLETSANFANGNTSAQQSGVTFNYGVVINGIAQGTNKPLLSVWKLNNLQSWMVLQLNGTMEYSLTAGNTPGNNYYNGISTGVSFVQSPSVIIQTTDCNNGGVNATPLSTSPTNPTFPILVKEDNQYIFAYEDLWPHLGDYDMNDIVFKINNIQKTMDNQNMVSDMSFDITPLAAGSTLKLSAALQFDEIASNNMSIKSTNSDSYLESGQTKANIILFPDVYKLFGKSQPSITNTYLNTGKITAQVITIKVSFTAPVSSDKVIIDKMNFYCIVDQINSLDRKEIHLGGYSPSSKVQKATNNYMDENNMVWGIMVPVGSYKYPTESTKIYDAYPQFKSWAISKNTLNQDWYLNPSNISGLIYNK